MANAKDRHGTDETPANRIDSAPDSNGEGDLLSFDGRLRIRVGPRTKAAGGITIAALLIAGIVQITLSLIARWSP